ncbi:MAG TPA: hypothetical protein PLH64_01800 [Anaerolineaceae bacterium]|nr:hypothetical protein [Anaerolineaceae bacterium]
MAIKTTESGTTLRNRLARSIVLAIRTLMQQGNPDEKSLDMAAYIVLALEKINETIEAAMVAWEKRDYWVKADQFRQEWSWIEGSQARLKAAVLAQDWAQIATEAISVGQRFSNVKIAEKNRIGEPWIGAWNALKQSKK